ncbi:putative reverse transcriptase domain-containing protein [Tanacetum coccineum]
MRQRRRIELFSDYNCEIRYHPNKANVVADALSRKEKVKLRRVRAMPMTIQSSIKDKLLAAQYEASKEENTPSEMMHGMDQQMEKKEDGGLYFIDRIWVPLIGDVRTMIMDEAHAISYFIHPGSDKMYYDLSDMYWWPSMKRDIATYVSKYFTCPKVKAEHQRPLTKSTHFLATREDYSMEKLSRLYIDEIMKALGTRLDMSTAYHPQTDGQSERTIQALENMLRACVMDFGGSWDTYLPLAEFFYNNSYHSSIRCTPFEAFYGRKCSAFGKKDMLAPSVLDVFHASNLKKCLADANLHVPLEGIKADKHSSFCEEPVEIIDRERGTPTRDGMERYAYPMFVCKSEPSEANEVNLRG